MLGIPLTRGRTGYLDDEDADLAAFKWCADRDGYAVRSEYSPDGRAKQVRLHRIVLERKLGRKLQFGEKTDHRNWNTTDNRRENLRLASNSQNQANARRNRPNASGYRGVFLRSKRCSKFRPWVARVKSFDQNCHLGYFATPQDAARAYDRKARELFGEFAFLNFPDLAQAS